MIKFLLIPLSIMLSCGSTKTGQSAARTDSAVVIEQPVEMHQRDSAILPEEIKTAVPPCIKNKIDSFKLKEQHERPQRVVEYKYKGKKVYYVVMPCCDFFNEVFDSNCKYLGAPDGGFTGRGDGKLPDFFTVATNEKLVWGTAKEK
ncbi:MAG: hypothetical protein ABIN74_07000 [Ferruginibacter sp.]